MKNAVIASSLAGLALAHPGHGISKRIVSPGSVIQSCTVKGSVALTFDDGPYIYTQSIVDAFTAAGQRVTFFQNGANYGSIFDYGPLLQSMIAGGHQIASHTMHHADLATLTADEITAEMSELEAAHVQLIGKAPTYMRPPYLSTNDLAVETLTALGFSIVSVDVDTFDYNEGPAGRIQNSIEWAETNITAGGTIVLNHDPYEQTATDFVPAIIKWLGDNGLKSVPVGECLGDAPENWYRTGSVASSSVSASGSATASATISATISESSVSSVSSGNGTGPYPTGGPSKPTQGPGGNPTKGPGGKPTISHPAGGWAKPTGPFKPVKPGQGDTEPGHGPYAGHGALPKSWGKGNEGCDNSTSYTGYTGGASGIWPPTNTSSTTATPSYYVNGANGLTSSAAIVFGIAALAFFL